MTPMSPVIHQHYVPQLHLGAFAIDPRINKKRRRIHVFDKTTRTHSIQRIKDIAQEHYFYDAPKIDAAVGQPQYLEGMFGKLENRVAPVLAKIIASATTGTQSELTLEDMLQLSAYIAFQFLRTKEQRQRIVEGWRLFSEELVRIHGPRVLADLPPMGPGCEAQLHGESLQDQDLLMRTASCMTSRYWAACTIVNEPLVFVTSDHPVVHEPAAPRPGPYGIADEDVIIALPISPKVLLVLLPASSEDPLLEPQVHGIAPEQVARFNRLQVVSATRYVYTSKPDFQFAMEVLDQLPAAGDPGRPRWELQSFRGPDGRPVLTGLISRSPAP